jgi:hypothetical protein
VRRFERRLTLVWQLLLPAAVPIWVIGYVGRGLASDRAMRAISWSPSDFSATRITLPKHDERQAIECPSQGSRLDPRKHAGPLRRIAGLQEPPRRELYLAVDSRRSLARYAGTSTAGELVAGPVPSLAASKAFHEQTKEAIAPLLVGPRVAGEQQNGNGYR